MSSARYGVTEVRGQTKTRRQNTLVCSQRVSELTASATAAKPARYGHWSRGSSEKPSSGVLDGLNSSDKIVGHTIEQ